jgi:hypothetical protein
MIGIEFATSVDLQRGIQPYPLNGTGSILAGVSRELLLSGGKQV